MKYVERAAKEMAMYLDELQRLNGLFYHAPDVPYFWGRGNGWMAPVWRGTSLSAGIEPLLFADYTRLSNYDGKSEEISDRRGNVATIG